MVDDRLIEGVDIFSSTIPIDDTNVDVGSTKRNALSLFL